MDAERFQQLADAYGADPRRWPALERAAGEAFAAANRCEAERMLFEARLIDAALEKVAAATVSNALRDQILESAPKPREQLAAPRSERPSWFGLPGWGLAAACAAGVIVGAAAIHEVAVDIQADADLASAEIGGTDAEAML